MNNQIRINSHLNKEKERIRRKKKAEGFNSARRLVKRSFRVNEKENLINMNFHRDVKFIVRKYDVT